ncbi:MAG: hypothetical protein M3520_11210 [Actinomycetota bacterium]|nr:hypothetical protein [Actinomycetota bacterium]
MPDRGYAAPDPATPHPPARHAPAPATPTAVCGCGVQHDLWVSGQGRWHWFCWAVLFPLFTLGLWVLAGAVALLAPDLPTAARVGIGVLPVLVRLERLPPQDVERVAEEVIGFLRLRRLLGAPKNGGWEPGPAYRSVLTEAAISFYGEQPLGMEWIGWNHVEVHREWQGYFAIEAFGPPLCPGAASRLTTMPASSTCRDRSAIRKLMRSVLVPDA